MQHIVMQIGYLVSLCPIFILSVRWEPAILSLLFCCRVCNYLSWLHIPLYGCVIFLTSPSSISSESSHAQQDVDIVVLGQELFLMSSVTLNKSWPNACCGNFIANTHVVISFPICYIYCYQREQRNDFSQLCQFQNRNDSVQNGYLYQNLIWIPQIKGCLNIIFPLVSC